jgi:hypothetical protein
VAATGPINKNGRIIIRLKALMNKKLCSQVIDAMVKQRLLAFKGTAFVSGQRY